MTDGFSERRDAEALQRAWERYERLLASGAAPEAAAREAARLLTPGAAPLFVLGDAIRVSARPVETPAFAARMEAELMAAHRRLGRVVPMRPRRTAGSTIMAFAASVAVLAGVLIGSSHSLPGDRLYGLKRASEEAQLAIVWGPTEANTRLSLAEERLEEVEGLFGRAQTNVLGVPGQPVAAAGPLDNMDPRIAQLIRDTLAEAEQQISLAAEILIRSRADTEALERLATVAREGASIAKGVAVTLPTSQKPPVLTTADKLATVAIRAQEVSQQVQQARQARQAPRPTPEPCPTPTPSPSPATSPSPTPSETPAGSPAATPSPSPTESPPPGCATPTPRPTPEPTPSPAGETERPKDSPDPGGASPAAQSASEEQPGTEDQSGADAGRQQPAS